MVLTVVVAQPHPFQYSFSHSRVICFDSFILIHQISSLSNFFKKRELVPYFLSLGTVQRLPLHLTYLCVAHHSLTLQGLVNKHVHLFSGVNVV